MYICKYCGKEFETSKKLGGHVSCCNKNPNYYTRINKIINSKTFERYNYNIKCKVCGKDFTLKLTKNDYNKGKYRITCSKECANKLTVLNTNLKDKNIKISNTIINNCKNKDITNNKICEYCGKPFFYIKGNKNNIFNSSKYCSKKCLEQGRKQKLRKIALKNNLGGYIPESINKYHSGNYDNIRFDSSWELAFYVYYKEHNLFIERCKEVRTYIGTDNKKHKYYPDFLTDNGIVEIKNYCNETVLLKHKYNKDIKILYFDDIKYCIDYVKEKYGNKFWENLYVTQ